MMCAVVHVCCILYTVVASRVHGGSMIIVPQIKGAI